MPPGKKKYVYYVCSANRLTHDCRPHSISEKELEEKVFHAIHDQIELVLNLEKAMKILENLPLQNHKVFSYEAQIEKLGEEIERYQKLKLRPYENFADGVIDKTEYTDFRNRYTQIIEDKQAAVRRLNKELHEVSLTGISEKNWVALFRQYENITELNRLVLMSLAIRLPLEKT